MMTGSGNSKSDFDNLPDEQVLRIFKYLPPDSFLGDMRVQLVSQRFNRLASDPSLQYKRFRSALIDGCRTDEDAIRILSNEAVTRYLYHSNFLAIFSVHSTLLLENELLQKLNGEALAILAACDTEVAERVLKTPALLEKLPGEQLSELSDNGENLVRKIILQYLGYLERKLLSEDIEKEAGGAWILQDENYQRGRNSEESYFWDSVKGHDLCLLVKNFPEVVKGVLHTPIFLDKINGDDLVLLANSPDNVERILFMMQQNKEVREKIIESWEGRFGQFFARVLQRGDITTVSQRLSQEQMQNVLAGNDLVILSEQSSDIASYILSDETLRGKLTFCNLISLYRQHADIRDQVMGPQLEKISTGTEDEALCLGYLLRGAFFAEAVPSIMLTLTSSEAYWLSPNNRYRPHFTNSERDFHDANLDEMDVTLAGHMFGKLRNRLIELKENLNPFRIQGWQYVTPPEYAKTYNFKEATQRSEKATQCLIWLYGLGYLYPKVAENIVRDPELREIFKEQGMLSRVSGFYEEVANLILETPAWRQEFNGNDLIHLGKYHISIARKIFSHQALIEKSPQEKLNVWVALGAQYPKLIEEYNLLSDEAFFNQLTPEDLGSLVRKGTINAVRHSIENKEEWKRKFSESPLFLSNLTYTVISKIAEERWDFYQRVTFSAQALKAAAEGAIEVQEESSVRGLLQKLNEILAPVPSSPENLQASSSRSLVEQFSACRVRGEDESGFTSAALEEKKRARSQKSLSM